MSLLSQQKRDEARALARDFKRRRTEAARAAYWGIREEKPTQLPLGLKRLETSEERDVWKRFISRQAIQEQNGVVQSDIASTVIRNPDVQQAFVEETDA